MKFILYVLALMLTLQQAQATVIDWDAVTTDIQGNPLNNLTEYDLFQSTSSFQTSGVYISTRTAMQTMTPIKIDASTTTYTAGSLFSGTSYYYRLTAENPSGMSGFNVDVSSKDTEVIFKTPGLNACDVNADNRIDFIDIQTMVNGTLGQCQFPVPCNVTIIQQIVNSALGGSCKVSS